MMDNEKWIIQNKLYHMKAKKSELEQFIKRTEVHYNFLNSYSFLKKEKDENIFSYIWDVLLLFLTGLDIVFGYYYTRYKAFYILKKAKKEIITLTKEIKYYEQY
jgi:hypothetical protein